MTSITLNIVAKGLSALSYIPGPLLPKPQFLMNFMKYLAHLEAYQYVRNDDHPRRT